MTSQNIFSMGFVIQKLWYVSKHVTFMNLDVCIPKALTWRPLRSIRKCVIKIVTLKGAHLMW